MDYDLARTEIRNNPRPLGEAPAAYLDAPCLEPAIAPPPVVCRCGSPRCHLTPAQEPGEGRELVVVVRGLCGREHWWPSGAEGVAWLEQFARQQGRRTTMVTTAKPDEATRWAAIDRAADRVREALSRKNEPVAATLRKHGADLVAMADLGLSTPQIARALGLLPNSGATQVFVAIREWRHSQAQDPANAESVLEHAEPDHAPMAIGEAPATERAAAFAAKVEVKPAEVRPIDPPSTPRRTPHPALKAALGEAAVKAGNGHALVPLSSGERPRTGGDVPLGAGDFADLLRARLLEVRRRREELTRTVGALTDLELALDTAHRALREALACEERLAQAGRAA